MQKHFKPLLTASVLAAGLSFVLPLQAQTVDKTGRFPAPQAQSAPATNLQAQSTSPMGQDMMMDHMNGMMANCCDPTTPEMEKRQEQSSGLYMDLERNLNENRRHMDYQTRQLVRERERE